MLVALLLSHGSLAPRTAPLTTLRVGDRDVRVRAPTDDAVIEAVMRSAHAAALADPERYDEIMEADAAWEKRRNELSSKALKSKKNQAIYEMVVTSQERTSRLKPSVLGRSKH